MVAVFAVCAIVGSVVVVVQFVLSLLGMGHEFGTDFGGDVHVDVGGFDHVDHVGGADGGHEGGHFFGILSFRAVTAALAMFGLAGLAVNRAGASHVTSVTAALAAGAFALVAVAWAMRFLYGLRDEGTVRIERSVGRQGTVYLTVPGGHAGTGKVFLNLQSRTVECRAVTAKDALPTGAPCVVVDVVGPNTVEVEAVENLERSNDA